jgi:hypothetical protein
MFLTVQFPLVDYRSLQETSTKLDRPVWPDPDPEGDNILYFGKIFNRNSKYSGPWDGEKRYCNVKSVINFCGRGENNFYNSLGVPWSSRILFRRLQLDGKFETKIKLNNNQEEIKELLYEHINQYLLCHVKIKKGSRRSEKKNRYTTFTPLIHAGNQLANSYYWATYKKNDKEKRTFNEKIWKKYVVKCDPVIIAQIDSSKLDLSNFSSNSIDISELNKADLGLYFDYIPHSYDKNKYNTKSWFISIKQIKNYLPQKQYEFKNYDETVRNLRINLIRLHAEVAVLKKLLERIGNNNDEDLNKPAVKKRVIYNLHKILLNLSKHKRNSQSQQNLVQVAMRLEEMINNNDVIEDQIKGLEFVIEELKQMDNNITNQTIIDYSIKYYTTMGDQITIGTITGNFINKSHLVNSLNSAAANGMSEDFKKELLEIAKKIEESQNAVAATVLDKMNEELAKPQPEQNKSKIKQFWDGLVKIMPDVTTIGKTIASVIALF